MGTLSPQSDDLTLPAEKLIETLSYSHFELLAAIDDHLKRSFYEIESVRGTWAVRELKRQIASLYYERSGLSRDKKKLTSCPSLGSSAPCSTGWRRSCSSSVAGSVSKRGSAVF